MADSLIRLIEDLALARGDEPVPRDYLVEALEKIEKGEVEVRRYPTGLPTAKGVYEIALKLYNEGRQTN